MAHDRFEFIFDQRLATAIENLADVLQVRVSHEASLRDQFAMAAMQGLCATPAVVVYEDIVRDAWFIADMMLEARKGPT